MDKKIDDLLARAAETPHRVDPALLSRIAASIGPSPPPVRPMPPAWLLTAGLIIICAAVALVGAARAGFGGFQKLSVLDRVLIFPVLGIFIALAATLSVSEFIPGSRRIVSPTYLLGAVCMALLGLFAVLFHEFKTEHFLSVGIACLATGLLHAVPTAIAIWFLLRRGFAVNPTAAGMVSGTLAGLAGLTMLEFHCPNFQVLHLMLWHTAVVLVSGVLGACFGKLTRVTLKSEGNTNGVS